MKKALIASLVMILGGGAIAGYRWTTRLTPVSLNEAVERFREIKERTGASAPRNRFGPLSASKKAAHGVSATRSRKEIAAKPQKPIGNAAASRVRIPLHRSDVPARSLAVMAMPREGVYTYDTSGYEQIFKWKRDFPERSRRLVTYDDADTWTEHHLFSQEREVWSNITMTHADRRAHYQRNYIKIAEYEKDEKVDFEPPAVSAVFPLHVGDSWNGEFTGESESGKYSGVYHGDVIDRKVMTVGNRKTQVWGVEMFFEFRGALEGTVEFRRWISTAYGVNVEETYAADVKVGPLLYHGEWTMRLTSLVPQR